MGQRRQWTQMLSVSDGYWGFIHKRRFFRFCYALLTFFSMFALVAAFFEVGAGTHYAPDYFQHKLAKGLAQTDESERLLQYIYVFYPTPLLFAWFLVYFGKFFFLYRIKRLRRSRNYKYNLLLGTILSAILYFILFYFVLRMDVIQGPKLRVALIISFCEFSLISIAVFDEQQVRKARHERKRLLSLQAEKEQEIRDQIKTNAQLGIHDVDDSDNDDDELMEVDVVVPLPSSASLSGVLV